MPPVGCAHDRGGSEGEAQSVVADAEQTIGLGKSARWAAGVGLVGSACQALQVTFHNAFCGWAFRCGCTWQWAGGWDCCNVHNTRGPKCPWCMARDNISWTTDCLVLALMVIAFHEARERELPAWATLAAPPVVFFVVGLVVAATFKIATHYPYFVTGQVHGKSE